MIICNYYRRHSDRTLWAVKLVDGAPRIAVGPLRDDQINAPPMAHDFRNGVDATTWDAADLEAESADTEWRLELP